MFSITWVLFILFFILKYIAHFPNREKKNWPAEMDPQPAIDNRIWNATSAVEECLLFFQCWEC